MPRIFRYPPLLSPIAASKETLLTSPAHGNLASLTTWRRLVFTPSPARFGINEAATTSQRYQLPIKSIVGGAQFLAKMYLRLLLLQRVRETFDGHCCGFDLAKVAKFLLPALLDDGNGVPRLRHIDADVKSRIAIRRRSLLCLGPARGSQAIPRSLLSLQSLRVRCPHRHSRSVKCQRLSCTLLPVMTRTFGH